MKLLFYDMGLGIYLVLFYEAMLGRNELSLCFYTWTTEEGGYKL